jgi:hypothetical protein
MGEPQAVHIAAVVRRLIIARRIAYTKLGKHVRVDSADLDAFVAAGRIEAVARADSRE